MEKITVTAYIGLGANLQDRLGYLKKALEKIKETYGIRLIACSGVYESVPEGRKTGPKFLNAVTAVETWISEECLLDVLEKIEKELGRTEKGTSGNRTIDLDLLLYGDVCLSGPSLVLPHPRMCQRRFVLEPMAELVPHKEIPGTGMKVSEHLLKLESKEPFILYKRFDKSLNVIG